MDYVDNMLQLAEETTVARVTADRELSSRAAYVFSVTISSNGSGESDAVLRDGVDATGEIVLDLYCADEEQGQLNFDPPIFFRKGIFVDYGTNVESVVVQFLRP